jgi:hypothetical protein
MTTSPTAWTMLGGGRYAATLPGGNFTFEMEREDMAFPEICDLAVRNNAKRRFLFVSKVLGRHIPVSPANLRDVAARLASKLRSSLKPGPVVFIGMAETATTLGQAVFREFLRQGGSGFYIESTRRPTGDAQAFCFLESHSHATAHLIHLPSREDDPEDLLNVGTQVVVVDDEATTAKTASGLVHALKQWRGADGVRFDSWLAVILRWKPNGRDDETFTGFSSLLEGRFTFEAADNLFDAPAATEQIDGRVIASKGMRHGGSHPQALPVHWEATAREGERVLIIGNGEYGFQPLLLAEEMEKHGADVRVMATTRSPILAGGAVTHIRSFPALSGESYTEFLYNVPPEHGFDRVILCIEDTVVPVGHPILQIPGLEVRT